MTNKPIIHIFVDGACRGNPGPGGWGAILRYGEHEKELSGFEPMTTNNRMELTAAIMALASLKKNCTVHVLTDSQYVQLGVTKWLQGWKARGWKNASKEPVKNQDLWQKLDQLLNQHQIHWEWVRGHSGHPENERADTLARMAIDEQKTAGEN